MMLLIKKSTLVVCGLLFLAMTATPANNAEQVVFSTPGFVMSLTGNTKATSTPFGFWIWCAAEAAPKGKGDYQNANACQGSMYFYELDKNATHIIGTVDEPSGGIYTASVAQGTFAQLQHNTLNPGYVCQLTNLTPDPKGPGNGVEVNCTFLSSSLGGGTGHAIVTNAVVNVTGP